MSVATIVLPEQKMQICRDPKDDILLECCLAAKADFLITGDKDLLDIGELPFELRIIAPSSFLKE